MKCKICHSLVPSILSGSTRKEILEEKRKQMVKVYLTHVFSELKDFSVVWDISTAEEFPFCPTCSDALEKIAQLVEQRDNLRKEIKNFVDKVAQEILTLRELISKSIAECGVDSGIEIQLENELNNLETTSCKNCDADYVNTEQGENWNAPFVKKIITTYEKYFLAKCFEWNYAKKALPFCSDCLYNITCVSEIKDELENVEEEIVFTEDSFALSALKCRKTARDLESNEHVEENCKEIRNSESSLENLDPRSPDCSSSAEAADFSDDDCVIIEEVSSINKNELLEPKIKVENSPSLESMEMNSNEESTAPKSMPILKPPEKLPISTENNSKEADIEVENSPSLESMEMNSDEESTSPKIMPILKSPEKLPISTENNSKEADKDEGPPRLTAEGDSATSADSLELPNSENILLPPSTTESVKMTLPSIEFSPNINRKISGNKCHLCPKTVHQQELEKNQNHSVNKEGNCANIPGGTSSVLIGTIGGVEISKIFFSQVSQDKLPIKSVESHWHFYCQYCGNYLENASEDDLIKHANSCRLINMRMLNSHSNSLLPLPSRGDTKQRHSRSISKYICKYCQRGFAEGNMLIKHEQIHYDIAVHSRCTVCKIVFSSREQVHTHFKSRSHKRKARSLSALIKSNSGDVETGRSYLNVSK